MHTHAHTHICVHTHTHIQPSQGIGIKEKVFKKRQAFKEDLKEYIKSWTDQGRTVEAFEMTIVIFWLMNDIYCK